MICRAGKQTSRHLAVRIPLPFTPAPSNTHFLQPSLQHCVLAHPLMPTAPDSQASSGWLGSERHFLLPVAVKMCAGGCSELHTGSLCSDRLCWTISIRLEWDMAPADAAQPSHAALAGPLRSDPRPPPFTPLPSPFPAQASSYLEQRELSLPDCVVVSDVNRWD